MPRFKQLAMLALAVGLSMLYARSAQGQDLGDDDFNRVYGIGNQGDVVVQNLNCDGMYDTCYKTYLFAGGSLSGPVITDTPPAVPLNPVEYSDSCVSAANFSISVAACNNGYVVFGAIYNNPGLASTICSSLPYPNIAEAIFCENHGELIGLFDGTDPFADFVVNVGDFGEVYPGAISLNTDGDYLFDDAAGDEIYLSVDTRATPEPTSIVLGGTACLLLAAFSSRRRKSIRSIR